MKTQWLGQYHVDTDRGRDARGKWLVRRPDGLALCLVDTRGEGNAIASDLEELRRLRVILAWTTGQLAETQACGMLKCKPEDLKRWRDTCLARSVK